MRVVVSAWRRYTPVSSCSGQEKAGVFLRTNLIKAGRFVHGLVPDETSRTERPLFLVLP